MTLAPQIEEYYKRPRIVAALFTAYAGPYWKEPSVWPWSVELRDARTYAGPYPVVAHPPCARWGRYWHGSPQRPHQFKKGDDGGCFEAALASVRTYGGVLEHPAFSHAWARFGLSPPPTGSTWASAGDGVGMTCYVDQGFYGHRASKPTWLYAAHIDFLPLQHTSRAQGKAQVEKVGTRLRLETPAEFVRVLVALARSTA